VNAGTPVASAASSRTVGTLNGRGAAALYLLLSIVFTWPLATGLTRDIPWDLGDSLLNCWILGWDADHLTRFFSGDFHAMRGFWNANIFFPEPLTLAYSEHLFAQALQILPVYALTHNIILCYNLLFLATFVLSGLGMFLFVREVTGSPRAGFVAGLIYAFAPLRVPQFAHLQVISSQWMPFALYGFRRYFDKRSLVSLAGGGLALVAQNLSCGYFLMFFAPCVLAYVIFEIASRRLWTDVGMWAALGAAGLCVAAATLPFLMPYLELRRLGFPARSYAEVTSYSADVYSYWTSPAESRVWGHAIRAFPKAEADLFPSITALALALTGLVVSLRTAWARSHGPAAIAPILTIFVFVVAAGCALYACFLVLIITGHGFADIGPVPITVKSLVRNFQILLGATVILLASSPRARSFAAQWAGSVAGFALLMALATWLLSLGPEIRTMGRTLRGTAPYAFFYWHVPGFDGLRVPARYGMLTMMFLSIAAGYGALHLERRLRYGGLVIILAGLFAVAESIAAPIVINGTGAEADYATPPSHMMTGDRVPPVYRYLATLPSPETVLAEFPFGQWTYELRYIFYSTAHWHPLINGYSGTFPLSYDQRAVVLRRPDEDPNEAWNAVAGAGVTHVVVHERFYKEDRGKIVSTWLADHGARLVAEFDGDKVFALKPAN
jgi:hypothetical protein